LNSERRSPNIQCVLKRSQLLASLRASPGIGFAVHG
jgi:hypothetical protein